MSVGEALQGMEMLKSSFESETERKKKEEAQKKLLSFQREERVGGETFRAGESEKERTFQAEQQKRQLGPTWARIQEEKRLTDLKLKAGETKATEIEGMALGETPEGRIEAAKSRAGIGLEQTMPSGSEMINMLMRSAATTKDPVMKKNLLDSLQAVEAASVEQAIIDSSLKAYNQSLTGKKTSIHFDPEPVMEEVRNRIKEIFPNYDVDTPLGKFAVQAKMDDPTYDYQNKRKYFVNRVSNAIEKSDPRFTNRPLAADALASSIYERIYTGGLKSTMYVSKTDKEGNPIAMKYSTIPIEVSTSTLFSNPELLSLPSKVKNIDIKDAKDLTKFLIEGNTP